MAREAGEEGMRREGTGDDNYKTHQRNKKEKEIKRKSWFDLGLNSTVELLLRAEELLTGFALRPPATCTRPGATRV